MKQILRQISLVTLFAVVFVLGLVLNAQAGEPCSKATWIGEYVFQGFGNVLVDGVNQPIVLMGHYTSDGKGNWVRGRGTTVQNGVTSHRTFTATYTIEPNCHGTYDGITEEGVPFYGELEVHSDGEEGVAIRTIPGQTIIFPNKRSK